MSSIAIVTELFAVLHWSCGELSPFVSRVLCSVVS